MIEGEQIASIIELVQESKSPSSATDISIVSVAYDDKRVQMRLEDGDNGATYVLRTKIATDATVPNKIVGKGKIEVRSDI